VVAFVRVGDPSAALAGNVPIKVAKDGTEMLRSTPVQRPLEIATKYDS
jgi:hypothetical protein